MRLKQSLVVFFRRGVLRLLSLMACLVLSGRWLRRVGRTELFLVEGGVPHFKEMVVLCREIVRLLVREYGSDFFVERLSDPYWLSCLSCVLGFEWDTSGQTTITLAALKEALRDLDVGVFVAGGKGAAMRETPLELKESLKAIGREEVAPSLSFASRLSCRVDNNAIQDSYTVYFHCVAISSSGSYAIINQGMNIEAKLARRYQWLAGDVKVEEPHTAISSAKGEEVVLDLTSRESRDCRRCILDVVRDSPFSAIQSDLVKVKNILSGQATLDDHPHLNPRTTPPHLKPPKKLDGSVLRAVKENADSFETILLAERVGASTLRGLAYISELVYGARASWRDPARFSYAFGSKSGRPYPVDKRGMVEAAEVLRGAVESTDSNPSRVMLWRLSKLMSRLEV